MIATRSVLSDDLVDHFDAPEVLDAAVTAIPASSSPTLTVVASLAKDANRVVIDDGIGSYIGLYAGDVDEERLLFTICGGEAIEKPLAIKAGTRLSLRAMQDAEITSGTVFGEFFQRKEYGSRDPWYG